MPEALAPDEPPRWVDAFPWLHGTGDPSWTAHGDPGDAERLAGVARLAVETQHAVPISRVFPRLRPDASLDELPLTARLHNILRRHALHTGADLDRMCVDDLLRSMQVGPWTVDSILRVLAAVSLTPPRPAGPPAAAPADEPPAPDPTALLTRAIAGLEPRMRTILRRRLLAEAPATLQELGVEFGVTRERVRQLEKKTLTLLAAPLGLPPGPARTTLEAYRERGVPVDDVLAAVLEDSPVPASPGLGNAVAAG